MAFERGHARWVARRVSEEPLRSLFERGKINCLDGDDRGHRGLGHLSPISVIAVCSFASVDTCNYFKRNKSVRRGGAPL